MTAAAGCYDDVGAHATPLGTKQCGPSSRDSSVEQKCVPQCLHEASRSFAWQTALRDERLLAAAHDAVVEGLRVDDVAMRRPQGRRNRARTPARCPVPAKVGVQMLAPAHDRARAGDGEDQRRAG